MRKSVSYLMTLKSELADAQRALHDTAVDIEEKASDILNITTEEARFDCNLDDYLHDLKTYQQDLDNELIGLEIAIQKLRKSFGYNTLQKSNK